MVVAQDLAPQSPATAAGVVLGVTAGAAGVMYVLLGRLQEAVGMTAGMAAGFALVIPAAAIALGVLVRHPEASR